MSDSLCGLPKDQSRNFRLNPLKLSAVLCSREGAMTARLNYGFMAWFTRQKPSVEDNPLENEGKNIRTEGLWQKCEACGQIIWRKSVEENMEVCTHCGHHFRIGARQRLAQLFDGGIFKTFDDELRSTDPLHFVDSKPYTERLQETQQATELPDAV